MTSLYKNWMTDSIESSPRERSPESFDFVLASLRINRRSFNRLICLAPLALALPAKKLYMYHDFFSLNLLTIAYPLTVFSPLVFRARIDSFSTAKVYRNMDTRSPKIKLPLTTTSSFGSAIQRFPFSRNM